MQADYKLLTKLQKYLRRNSSPTTRNRLRGLGNCSTYPATVATGDDTTAAITITVNKYKNGEKHAKFVGLKVCHNKWACPVCAPFFLMRDRMRITKIIEREREAGYRAFLMTLTIPHYINDPAAVVLDRLMFSKRRFMNYFTQRTTAHRPKYRNFEDFDYHGSISSIECKYSKLNGFHFHYHIALFIKETDTDKFFSNEETLRKWWQKEIMPYKHAGTTLPLGLHISRKPIENGDYLAKELAKTSNGKSLSRDMFDLLRSDDVRDYDAFIEYAEAVRYHPRIRCSSGLAQDIEVSIDDIKKKLTAASRENPLESTAAVASFTPLAWTKIIAAEQFNECDHRGNLLAAAEQNGADGVADYCRDNELPPPITPTLILDERLCTALRILCEDVGVA